MRLRQRDLKTYYVKPFKPIKDDEGSLTDGYDAAYEIIASIQPLSGQVAATEYGQTLQYMLSMRLNNLGSIKEKDGVCVYVDSTSEPDYEVISIKPWTIPVLELKKRGVTGG